MAEKQRARNLGSSYTTFRYAGRPIAYLGSVKDSGQVLLGEGAQFIHPLGSTYPIEIVTGRALDGGKLTLSITELWHEEVWEQLAGLANTHDIIQVFDRLSRTPNYITCTKIINPPDGRRYGKTYHRCVITNIEDGESFDVTTLSSPKTVEVSYTHTTPL